MSKKEKKLKHLGFLRAVTLLTWAWMLKLYEFHKRKLPLLGSVMFAVETSTPTTTILVPLFDKFTYVSYNLLLFADRKSETLVVMAEKHMPVSVMGIVKLTQYGLDTFEEVCDKIRLKGILRGSVKLGIKFLVFIMNGAKKLLVKLCRFPHRPSLSVPYFSKKVSGTADVASPLRETVSLPIIGSAVNTFLASGVMKKLSSSPDNVNSKTLRASPLPETVSLPIVGIAVNTFLGTGVMKKLSSSPKNVISKRLRSWTSIFDGEVKDETGRQNTLN